MNKFTTYFGQLVTNDELNGMFGSMWDAIEQFILDFGYFGIAAGGDLTPNSAPNLTVRISTPAVIYDQLGNRINIATSPVVNVVVDENNQLTAVTTSGNARWLSVFVKFKRTDADPRIDDLGEQVFFRQLADFDIHVVQAAEATAAIAARPPLRGDSILLGDIKRTFNQSTITAASIDLTRQQTIYNLQGLGTDINAKNLRDVIQSLATLIASVSNLAAIPGSPFSLPAGTIPQVLAAFLAAFNSLKTQVNGMPQNTTGLAKLADANIFTNALNTFNSIEIKQPLRSIITSALTPMLSSNLLPPVDGWRLIGSFPIAVIDGATDAVHIYYGNVTDTETCFAICSNAKWNGSQWEALVSTLASSAVLWSPQRIRLSNVSADTQTWAAWPSTLPTGVNANSIGVHIANGLSVSGNVRIQKGLVINGDLGGSSLSVLGTADVTGDVSLGANLTLDHGDLHVKKIDATHGGTITADRAIFSYDGVSGKLVYAREGGLIVDGISQFNQESQFKASLKLSPDVYIEYETPRVYTDTLDVLHGKAIGSAWTFETDDRETLPDPEAPAYGWKSTAAGELLIPIKLPSVISKLLLLRVMTSQPFVTRLEMALIRLSDPGYGGNTRPDGPYIVKTLDISGSRGAGIYWDDLAVPTLQQHHYAQSMYALRVRSTNSNEFWLYRGIVQWSEKGVGRQAGVF